MEEPQQNTRGMGKGMLVVAWVLLLAVLAWIFGNWEERQFNPNQDIISTTGNQFIEVTLDGNRMHHYVASGEINGESVIFLLDTGATDVVVSEDLARDIGLRFGVKGYARTANGTVEVWQTVLDRVSLGAIELTSHARQ